MGALFNEGIGVVRFKDGRFTGYGSRDGAAGHELSPTRRSIGRAPSGSRRAADSIA